MVLRVLSEHTDNVSELALALTLENCLVITSNKITVTKDSDTNNTATNKIINAKEFQDFIVSGLNTPR